MNSTMRRSRVRRWASKWWLLVVGAVVLVGLGGLVWAWQRQNDFSMDNAALQLLPRRSPAPPKAYLVDVSKPWPTNKWFSPLVFAEPSRPVFAYPLSYQTTANGVSLGSPAVMTSADTIFAEHQPDVRLDLGSDQALVKSYDDLSVLMTHRSHGREVATSRVTEGSPFVFFHLASHVRARFEVAGLAVRDGDGSQVKQVRVGSKTYGLVTYDGATVNQVNQELVIDAGAKGGAFSVFVLPSGGTLSTWAEAAKHPLASTMVSYQQRGDTMQTTYHLATSDGRPTIFGLLPTQRLVRQEPSDGSLETLYGKQTFVAGTDFTTTASFTSPPQALALDTLTTDQRDRLARLLATDITNLSFDHTDTYFGGKDLYRAANLLQLAEQLGLDNLSTQARQKLARELNVWLDPLGASKRSDHYFYYNSAVHGVVGVIPSYGSDQFNDHHFHYGYFIYAASILARYDADFYREHRSAVDMLVRDIANPVSDASFPKLRTFDMYTGHSWADGYAMAGDGNDQESSSEAVLAWYASYLWGRESNDTKLTKEAAWLYQRESEAAQADWLHVPTSNALAQGYGHGLVSLVWGGKLDYATFFSGAPEAKLGIQLIPLSPGHAYVGDDATNVQQHLRDIRAALDGQEPAQFADYLLMYQATVDPKAAAAALGNLQPSQLDGGDSLSYVTAWVYSYLDK